MIIYKVTNTKTGKVYVGQTVRELKTRRAEHLRTAQAIARQEYPTPLHVDISAIGSAHFEWAVLETCAELSDLNFREKFWIAHFHCMEPEGYNQTTGGAVDSTMSERTRFKIAESMRENHKDAEYTDNLYPKLKGLVPPNKGIPMSEAQKLKVGAARKAVYADPTYVNPNVGQKRTGEALANLHEAYKTRELPTGDAWKESHANQYTAEVREKMSAAKRGKKPHNTRKVLCIDTGEVFDGLTEAAKGTGAQRQSIYLQIKGVQKLAGGKRFKYLD